MLPTVTLLSRPSVSWSFSVKNVDHARRRRSPGSLQSSSCTTASAIFLRLEFKSGLFSLPPVRLSAVPVPVLCVSRGLQQRDQRVHGGVRTFRHLCDAGVHSPRRLPEDTGTGRNQFRGRKSSSNPIIKNVSCFPLSETGQPVPLSDPQHLPLIVRIPHRAFWWLLCQRL